MSAITVIYNLDGRPVESRVMDKVLDRLEHRGKDGRGVWIDCNIGLGHRMRWTTPESLHEVQPMKSAESSSVITCDARIDNRYDLVSEIGISNRSASEMSDAEIILKAYEKWGRDCIEKLIGDFVFAIWDPNEQKLICARDSMGIKHFYYYYKPGEIFAVASEAKALFCHPSISKEINETNIGDVLIFNFEDKENTPFKDVKRLPANKALEVSPDHLDIWRYWFPKPRSRPMRFRSHKYYEEQFREILSEAVTCRLRSAYPVGAMLSGGLDSSSISCIASRYLSDKGERPLETFSAIFPSIAKIDSRIDEREFIDSVVKQIDCNPNYVEADTFSPLLDMDKLHWHADHPIGAPNVFMDWALFKAAKERNVRVLLSGFDGDSTVSHGYEAFSHLARRGRWLRMVRDARALNRNMPRRQHDFKRLVWRKGIKLAIPESILQMWRVARGRPRKLEKSSNFPSSVEFNYQSANSTFVAKHSLRERYFELIEKNYPVDVDYQDHYWNGLSSGLFAFALETFEKTAAAFEVEPSFPFFDRRVIEFCIALPPEQKIYNGWTRSIFRRAMENILPSDVQWRKDKANIGLSFKVNLLKYGADSIHEAIFEYPEVLEKYIDIEALTDSYDRYKSEPLKYEREPMFIIASVYLSNWLRQAFENRVPMHDLSRPSPELTTHAMALSEL